MTTQVGNEVWSKEGWIPGNNIPVLKSLTDTRIQSLGLRDNSDVPTTGLWIDGITVIGKFIQHITVAVGEAIGFTFADGILAITVLEDTTIDDAIAGLPDSGFPFDASLYIPNGKAGTDAVYIGAMDVDVTPDTIASYTLSGIDIERAPDTEYLNDSGATKKVSVFFDMSASSGANGVVSLQVSNPDSSGYFDLIHKEVLTGGELIDTIRGDVPAGWNYKLGTICWDEESIITWWIEQ